jgi:uncharacterized protein DUF6893
MSEPTAMSNVRYPHVAEERSTERYRALDRYRKQNGSSTTMWLTGLTFLGLGALAFYYLGPDLKRYLKIRHM